MTSEHTCARCDRPMRHDTALVCSPCGRLLRRHLEDVARVAGEITITVARLDRVLRIGGRPDDLGWWRSPDALEPMPLPVNLDAAERHDAAVAELLTWARAIGEERLWPDWSAYPHKLEALARFLAEQVDWLRHQPYADEAWPALLAACAELRRVVDTHVPADLAGLCACGTARYADERACRRCGTEGLAYTRADMEAQMQDAAVTASEAAQWIAHMGLIADTGRLRKLIWAWADRGHLAPVDDVPRYRFGDVLGRVLASPALRVA